MASVRPSTPQAPRKTGMTSRKSIPRALAPSPIAVAAINRTPALK